MKDDFGDRMKLLEGMEAGRQFLPLLPIIARLDGKGFSKYTKNLKRPFDPRLSNAMVETTMALVKETCANIGYTQSDEITLVFYSSTYENQIYFDGNIQKMTSVIASLTTAFFAAQVKPVFGDGEVPDHAIFDCRVWQVPTKIEAANAVLWREKDATKNSISMAARAVGYETKQLHKKSGKEMQEMLFQKGINWNDYPAFFKRGTYVQRKERVKTLDPETLAKIPENRRPPDGKVARTAIERLEMPPFTRVTNREGVIFDAEEPILRPPLRVCADCNETEDLIEVSSNNWSCRPCNAKKAVV